MKFLKGKVDEQFDLWQYDYNPLFVNTGLTNAQKHELITQAEEQYYLNNNTDYTEWVWTYAPMYIVGRPVSKMDILYQDGAIVLVGIIPTGRMTYSTGQIDPIVPIVCGYDALLNNETYTQCMSGLISEMQEWVERYEMGKTNAYSDRTYMDNVKYFVERIVESVKQSVLLSLHEQMLFHKLLWLFASNPLASLQYALKMVE